MNKRDCNNLSVIIQKKIEGDDALNDWLETLSEDDLYYALDVLLEHLNTQAFPSMTANIRLDLQTILCASRS